MALVENPIALSIQDFIEICRLCGKKGDQLSSLYEHITKEKLLSDSVKELIGINAFIGDELPEKVCSLCILVINNFLDFMRSCLETQEILQKVLKDSSSEKRKEKNLVAGLSNDSSSEFVDTLFVKVEEVKNEAFEYEESDPFCEAIKEEDVNTETYEENAISDPFCEANKDEDKLMNRGTAKHKCPDCKMVYVRKAGLISHRRLKHKKSTNKSKSNKTGVKKKPQLPGGRSEQMFANLYPRICSDQQNHGFRFGSSDSDRRQKRFGLPGSKLFFANPKNLRIPGKIRKNEDDQTSDASDTQLPEFSSPELMPGTSVAEGGHGSRRERDLYRDWDILNPFFKCGVGRDAGFALCAMENCTARLKVRNDTNSNLNKHFATKHPLDSPALKAALHISSKRGRSSSGGGRDAKSLRQGCIEEVMAERFDQQKALDLFYEWIIHDMLHTITTESEVLRAFLNYLNPQFKLPSRKKLGDDIKHMSARAKNELTHIMSKQDYMATTAESWSSHNRAFIGSTVSWLDKATLERTTAVLGMKEVKESPTAEYLARSLRKLHEDFSISSKILCMTTDNGTNYVSAFVNFAQEDVVIQPGEDKADEDKADEELADEPQVISMEEALDQADEAEVCLPKHQRCVAHTLSLLASEDVSKVPQWNHGSRNIFRRSAAKAQSLWNAQGRRTVAANEIKGAIGKKLKVPGATRWNSSYDSYKMISGLLQDQDTRKKINDICTTMHPNPIPAFVDEDNEVIAEYVKVMAPVANALDKMQSDQHAYMGNVLPNLMVLQRDLNLLRDDNSIKHAKPLVSYLLGTQEHHGRDKKGFTKRFQHMFEDQEKLLATAFHPRFRLKIVKYICRTNPDLYNLVRDKMVSDLVAQIRSKEGDVASASSHSSQPTSRPQSVASHTSEHDEFAFLLEDEEEPVVVANLEEEVGKEVDTWGAIVGTSIMKISPANFPKEHRQHWVNCFIKYNTPLPSSASAERLFSFGSDILRPTRASLTNLNFENLTFMKGNLNLVKRERERADKFE